MKKIIALLLMLAMLVCCFASCGSDAETTSSEETSSVATKTVLKMGTNAYFQPYEYYDGEKIIGIDAEIAEAIAEKLG
ncbi:MAG: transporter substrate-binding domain-containing protein, partial [Clostridia bacterium]|nr:transporter substrate-binding domain-containing protein [Clostridia bacterium]